MLVFVQSIDRAKELFHELIYDGINVEVIHADRTQAQRDNIVRAFREQKVHFGDITLVLECLASGHEFYIKLNLEMAVFI